MPGYRAIRHLHVGGVFALGFDPSGEYLLVISHNGRGVFSTRTWERVARNRESAYPGLDGHGDGIGPLEGFRIAVTEKNYLTEELAITNSDGTLMIDYSEGTIVVSEAHGE